MEMIEIEKKINELAIDNSFKIDEQGVFVDLDSFAFVSFLVSMEDEFGITFPDESLKQANMNSVIAIKKVVTLLLEDK